LYILMGEWYISITSTKYPTFLMKPLSVPVSKTLQPSYFSHMTAAAT